MEKSACLLVSLPRNMTEKWNIVQGRSRNSPKASKRKQCEWSINRARKLLLCSACLNWKSTSNFFTQESKKPPSPSFCATAYPSMWDTQLHTFFQSSFWDWFGRKKGSEKASRQAVLIYLWLLSIGKKQLSLGIFAPDTEACEEA